MQLFFLFIITDYATVEIISQSDRAIIGITHIIT